ncbi:MAG: NADH-quinone oxidoreductase subunit J [Nitrososphaerota archaeon]|nr:NADH-quinone oxidoreductase subunit J [Nitrososphaerota archaeon]MDG6973491.1 NADH-quinone oxidoreductase subunit J [Nitrososphaerota archaeon]MDG6975055.1 NADH-quinone oxidoreductase subunit J [Nitrososphaerota archaeon]MDG7009845.1 NADH-quinone oxidoreductase subunit J [Nitrososphaerota archaeon]MDG7030898.1 NADH-quinone oxidoreductase subunit J [Nitrososphaerota archaeon]
MAVVTLASAIFSLEAKEIVYGAIGLAGSLFGVAALFFLLDAPYVAVFQIAVYIGAVAVLILFTVMLVRQERWAKEVKPASGTTVAGAITGVAVVVALAFAVVDANLSRFDSVSNTATFVDIGKLISTGYAPVLEVLALVLAASIVGALALSKVDREGSG